MIQGAKKVEGLYLKGGGCGWALVFGCSIRSGLWFPGLKSESLTLWPGLGCTFLVVRSGNSQPTVRQRGRSQNLEAILDRGLGFRVQGFRRLGV